MMNPTTSSAPKPLCLKFLKDEGPIACVKDLSKIKVDKKNRQRFFAQAKTITRAEASQSRIEFEESISTSTLDFSLFSMTLEITLWTLLMRLIGLKSASFLLYSGLTSEETHD